MVSSSLSTPVDPIYTPSLILLVEYLGTAPKSCSSVELCQQPWSIYTLFRLPSQQLYVIGVPNLSITFPLRPGLGLLFRHARSYPMTFGPLLRFGIRGYLYQNGGSGCCSVGFHPTDTKGRLTLYDRSVIGRSPFSKNPHFIKKHSISIGRRSLSIAFFDDVLDCPFSHSLNPITKHSIDKVVY